MNRTPNYANHGMCEVLILTKLKNPCHNVSYSKNNFLFRLAIEIHRKPLARKSILQSNPQNIKSIKSIEQTIIEFEYQISYFMC